ncbi:1-phosphofructokinase [Amycolatopsis mediterranei S699]|uniref:1-phosphofructokinase n=2 Tax=Amycolatopsis mediterranei TaxID=33910 RepID=A0A0H3DHB0_AMYMU|nr:1-phosphofructokinase [Amycolatopsis mediterranei U32]AEK46500.1 1-phosphofructokinase [Amycolatopsis mediterranei S699]AGT88360.1 1-phosphofructokinase [Amycolatopsis mediterranei RB]KDO04919.1 phosphofructokinase [Amycolatopsis mediterranei]AFO81232.1 1-phosphofructokinase [Amycolatopsis mediterranei S699]
MAVFAPSPQLTVTVEETAGVPDVHVHAGGQGVWQSRMIQSLGATPVLCCALGGETGQVLRHLIGVELQIRDVAARNGAYVHDRREGHRDEVVRMPADALSRHELDDLYELTLVAGLGADVTVLSGPAEDDVPVPHSVYERLARDLAGQGARVVVDLSGERLARALAGGPEVVKVSHEELVTDGLAESDTLPDLAKSCREVAKCGARAVVVSRAAEDTLALVEDELWLVESPELTPVDPRGGGDSMTAGLAVGLAQGRSLEEALKLGAAAGAVNVTRHGLGSGSSAAVRELARRVRLKNWEDTGCGH